MIRQALRLAQVGFGRPLGSLVNQNLRSTSNALLSEHNNTRTLAAAPQLWRAYSALSERAGESLLLLNAMGEDREGKMSSISSRVVANGGFLEDSKMTRMRGEIGIILMVRIDEQSSVKLVTELTEMESLQVRSKWVEAPDVVVDPVTTLELVAVDRPGLVNDINQYLRTCGIVIHNLNLNQATGLDEEGKEICNLRIDLTVPDNWRTTSHVSFTQDLRKIGAKVDQMYSTVMVGSGVMRMDLVDMLEQGMPLQQAHAG